MFPRLSRSWEYARISFRILRQHQKLLVFPILSTLAALAVVASFFVPFHGSGVLEDWLARRGGTPGGAYLTAFLFYLCLYFVIVFFNAALVACTMRVLDGRPPGIRDGLAMAGKRFLSIFAWAVVSASVATPLRALESSDKFGALVARVLGAAWTALTYFVVPVIVADGAGPVAAFKRSARTLKDTWGAALLGNFTLGWLTMLMTLPLILCGGLLFHAAWESGSIGLFVLAVLIGGPLLVIAAAVCSAVDTVFKAVLFNYATGRNLPWLVHTRRLRDAFTSRP